MVRIVPVIHRTPPPPLDKLFEAPVVPEAVATSSAIASSSAPVSSGNHQRRTYIAGKFAVNGSHAGSSSKAPSSNGVTSQTTRQFSLFDYLQELVRLRLNLIFDLFFSYWIAVLHLHV